MRRAGGFIYLFIFLEGCQIKCVDEVFFLFCFS